VGLSQFFAEVIVGLIDPQMCRMNKSGRTHEAAQHGRCRPTSGSVFCLLKMAPAPLAAERQNR
jgi:hypothetical protein